MLEVLLLILTNYRSFLYKIVAYVDWSSLFEIIILVEAMGGVLVPKTVCAQ